jgi:heme-degrading monooxygenase HmoA
MPAIPWKSFAPSDSGAEYVALVSSLPLKSYGAMPAFFRFSKQIGVQLKTAKGLIGYSLLARPLTKRFWTLSVWESEEALRNFVHSPPHVTVMAEIRPRMGETKFTYWQVRGSELPLKWDEGLRRLDQK